MILPNLALQPPYAIEEKVWAEHKTELFVATAFENLAADIARGKGECLASLATMLNVPVEH